MAREHCRRRPWEPEKFATESEQAQYLENLLLWVSEYETREDEYGLKQHRRLFDSFSGRKFEFTSVVPNAAQQIIEANPTPLSGCMRALALHENLAKVKKKK